MQTKCKFLNTILHSPQQLVLYYLLYNFSDRPIHVAFAVSKKAYVQNMENNPKQRFNGTSEDDNNLFSSKSIYLYFILILGKDLIVSLHTSKSHF